MAKVDRLVYDPGNIKLDIYYTAKRSTFHCTYAGKLYENQDASVLKREVLDAIKAAYALEWIPVIEIAQPGMSATGVKFPSLHIERKYIGFHTALGYKQCHWTAEPDRRLAVSQSFNWHRDQPFDLPASQEHYTEVLTWLPYTEETWLQLEELTKYLRIAQSALQKSIVDKTGVTRALEISRSLFDHFATRNDEPGEGGDGSCC